MLLRAFLALAIGICAGFPAAAGAATSRPEKARWTGTVQGGGTIAFDVSKPKTLQFGFIPPFDVRFLGFGYRSGTGACSIT